MRKTTQLKQEQPQLDVTLKRAVDLQIVTPKMAEKWLKNNPKNRPVERSRVLQYKKEIELGRWQENDAAISFCIDGSLMNGQHRLTAIAETGISLELIVVRNLKPEAISTIDIGRKRTIKDMFIINGYTYSSQLGAVSGLVFMFMKGEEILKHTFKTRQSNYATIDDLFDIVEKNPEIYQSCITCQRDYKELSFYAGNSNVSALYYLFSQKDSELTKEMFSALNSGAIPDENSVILECRNLLIKEKISQKSRRVSDNAYRVSLLVRTWNQLRDGLRDIRLVQDYSLPIPVIK